ncbi:SGNH/GDSL hydrolase family protein [Flavobacterium sp. H122]|uniref:SGNH/GDSL hydrolase family protein n=1 Tax=Flavobacterium sp. H122 TaxID=2529860 RepID=UPI0010AB0845|nr:SGNH/GDSL hydrolase family protein [Flavobacterium sp. H122]
MTKNIKWLLLASLTLVACNDDDNTINEEPVSAGTADFSKYVALGDSFAAGFSDGALFKTAQTTSYPSILTGQFEAAGGGVMTIPYMNDDFGGLLLGGNPIPGQGVRLYFGKPEGADFDEPLRVPGASTTEVTTKLTGTFSNLGVPGARCIDLVKAGWGNPSPGAIVSKISSPYYARFASSSSSTVMADALTQQPTFFSLWIGGNDALGYALAGGDTAFGQLTPSAGESAIGFDASYDELINSLTANGRKGVIANLPYITNLPQFTYLKPSFVDTFKYYTDGDEKKKTRVVSAGDVATINQINSIVGFLDQVLTAYGQPNRFAVLSSATGAVNPVLIKDETLTDFSLQITGAAQASGNATLMALASHLGETFGKARQTTQGDLIPLISSEVIGKLTTNTLQPGVPDNLKAYGITYPLEDRHVLIPTEITEINNQIDAYNVKIEAVATAKGLAFVNAKNILKSMSEGGVSESGYTLTTEFVLGGMFSLDGIHPTPRGYAYIANRFIDAINAKYGSTLKKVNIGTYRVLFPRAL